MRSFKFNFAICFSLLLLPNLCFAQFDTATSIICVGCEFSEMLVDWDTIVGTDALVQSNDSLFYESNQGLGSFGPAQLITVLPSESTFEFFEDVDDDGDWDLFASDTGIVHLLLNDSGSFTSLVLDSSLIYMQDRMHPAEFGFVRSMYVNEDSLKDLTLRVQSANIFKWYENNGGGSYILREDTIPVSPPGDGEIVALDWDGDGFNDLITAASGPNNIVALGQSSGNWSTVIDTLAGPSSSYGIRYLDVMDVNGDGKLDLVNCDNLFLSDPDSVHYYRRIEYMQNYYEYRRFVNLDCDADLEMYGKAINVGNATFTVMDFENDTVVIDTYSETNPFIASPLFHTVADLNADGAMDLLFKDLWNQAAPLWIHDNLAVEPMVSLTLPFMVLPYGTNAQLSGGIPLGGTYSGPGIVGDSLFTVMTSGGPIVVTYTFTTEQGCSASDSAVVDISTGYNSIEKDHGLSIYPVPANDIVTVRTSGPIGNYVVIDSRGLQVLEGSESSRTLVLDITSLDIGLYAITVLNERKSLVRGTFIRQ